MPETITTNPTLTVTLNKNQTTRPLSYQETEFAVSGQTDQDFPISTASSTKVVAIAHIVLIKKIIATGPAGKSAQINISVDNGSDPPFVISLPFTGIFIYMPTAAYAPFITGITIQTPEASVTLFNVKVFG